MGADFSGVRVHTGPSAAELAWAAEARAFTVGRDVVFGAGGYAPSTAEGRGLLAHELARVVQHVLGHSNVQVTQRYAHLGPDVMMKAMKETFGSKPA